MENESGIDPAYQLAEFANLTFRKRLLKDEIKVIDGALADLENGVLEFFAETGGVSWKSKDHYSVYIDQPLRPKVQEEEWPAICRALEATGNEVLLQERANLTTLWALLTEYRKGDGIPPELSIITLDETWKAHVRRA